MAADRSPGSAAERSPRARLDGGARLTIDLAAPDRFPLVVSLLAARQCNPHLDAAALHVDLERHQRQPFLGDAADDLADLVTVQQQLALPQLGVIGGTAVAVRTDVDVEHPQLAVLDPGVAVPQVD